MWGWGLFCLVQMMPQKHNQEIGQMEQPCLSKENYMKSSLRDEANEKNTSLKSQDFLVSENLVSLLKSLWVTILKFTLSSVQFSGSVVSDSLRPHEPQHARPPHPSPTPRVHTNPCLSSQWCHPTISSSVIPFSSCPQSFPASGSFQMSQLFASGAKVLAFQLQQQSFQWIFRTDFL